MPFSHSSSAASVRIRRAKDKNKDSRSIGSTSNSKRSRENAKANNRSPPPQSPQSSLASLYAQQNVTLDQLPALPSSGATSPSSGTSPVLRANLPVTNLGASQVIQSHPYTPAALQQYLEKEDEDDSREIGTAAGSRPSKDQSFRPNSLSTQEIERRELPNEPLRPHTAVLASPLLQKLSGSTSLRAVSPPPQARSPAAYPSQTSQELPSQLYSVFGPPISHNSYLSQGVGPSVPFQPNAPNDHYLALAHPQTYDSPMSQPSGQVSEFLAYPQQQVPYFAGYGSPPPTFIPSQPIQSPPPQGRSSGTTKPSLSGETFLTGPLPHGELVEPKGVDALSLSGLNREDDGIDLLRRIQSAIPDLHTLLNRYREAHGQLGARENLLRQAESQKAEALKQKELYIESLGKELEFVSQKHSAESSKLRLEIGNLEEKHKEIQDNLVARKRSRDELEAAHRDLQHQNDLLQRNTREEREAINREFDRWKEQATQEFVTKEKSKDDKMQEQVRTESALRGQIADMEAKHNRERDLLQTSWECQKRDLEASQGRVRQDLEATIKAKDEEIKAVRNKERQNQEAWNKEREALAHSLDERRAELDRGWEEEKKSLRAQYEREKEDLQERWNASYSQKLKRLEEDKAKMQRDVDRLKQGWDKDKVKFTKATNELKAVAGKLDNENHNLQKMIEAFGEATDFRSRGDAYFVDAFNQLRKQISDLAAECCSEKPKISPDNILEKIPAKIPSFFSDTESSVQLRTAYIKHILSSILTQRIFQPFLFTLNHRNDSADSLFRTMSSKLRSKSIRREALWRQHTLHAAYTVSSAKQSINKLAATIVEEIMDEIKHFTTPHKLEQVTVAVRRIVKTAAETWRYARLEREMITASMSVVDCPSGFDEASGQAPASTQRKEALLPLLPFVEREPAHEDFRSGSNSNDQGCVYSRGLALYSNDPMVLDRFKEIAAIGGKPSSSGVVADSKSVNERQPPYQCNRTVTPPQPSPAPFENSYGSQVELSTAVSPRQQQLGNDEVRPSAESGCVEAQGDINLDDPQAQTPISRSSDDNSDEHRSLSTATPVAAIPKWGESSGQIAPYRDGW